MAGKHRQGPGTTDPEPVADSSLERTAAGSHPDPEDLWAYATGRCGTVSREKILSHIATCNQCADAVLDLKVFPDLQVRQERDLPAVDPEAEWQTILRRAESANSPEVGGDILQASRVTTTFSKLEPKHNPWSFGVRAAIFTAAAALLVLAGYQSGLLPMGTGTVGLVEKNVYFQSLSPAGTRVLRSGGPTLFRVPPEMESYLIFLELFHLGDHEDYSLQIWDRRDELVLQQQGLHRSEDGALTLQLARGVLPPGAYRIELVGSDSRSGESLATYHFRLELP